MQSLVSAAIVGAAENVRGLGCMGVRCVASKSVPDVAAEGREWSRRMTEAAKLALPFSHCNHLNGSKKFVGTACIMKYWHGALFYVLLLVLRA